MKRIFTITLIILIAFNLNAINVKNLPRTIIQPDGTKIECFITGDEFGGMIHDADGYAIKRNSKTGWWYYSTEKDGKAICSEYIVGKTNPKEKGLKKGIFEFNEAFYKDVMERRKANKGKFKFSGGILKSISGTATVNTIVIFVRFDGAPEFYQDRDYYTPFFNSTTQESLKDYIQEVSYNKMNVNSTFYPECDPNTNLSYEDTYTRDYYIKDDYEANGYANFAERTDMEHGLVKRAVEAIASEVPIGINLDANNDGNIDHVCIIVQGGSANVDHGDLLWPHEWSLSSEYTYINDKRVYDYTFLNTALSFDEKTICHEFLHVVGMPDLYHQPGFYDNLEPAGYWDTMGDTHDNFPHPGTYLKYEYAGWINSIPEITTNGRYTLNPITSSSNNCFKIKSPMSCEEYFIIEYRKGSGDYESTIEGDGLLVYRINEGGNNYIGVDYDQDNNNELLDEVYIYRPNGTLSTNGSPQSAYFSSQASRTSINDNTNPSSFLWDNSNGGLRISNISNAGTSISFDFEYPYTITSESDLVCSGGSVFTANNLPGGYTISWTTSSNLEVVSGGSTATPTIRQKNTSINGEGWVQVNLTSGGCTTAACKKEVWVGAPIIDNISGPTYTPNGQWATYYAELESDLSDATDYSWTLNPLNGNSVYDYGWSCDIAFYNSGSYQLVVQAQNTCSDPNYGPYYVTGIEVYDDYYLLMTPNPTQNEATLTIKTTSIEENTYDETAEWEMEIYDQSQLLKEKKTKIKGKSTKIQTAGWKEGIYLVRVKYKDKILTGKLVVKK